MPKYHRIRTPGGSYFFTVNCARRVDSRLLVEHIDGLRAAMRAVKAAHPFRIDALVVLPEHLHCIWTLPAGDSDYGMRWALIKASFSRGLPDIEARSVSRRARGERGIWQRRFWEHAIRDDDDFGRHVDYIPWNPVKHGWVDRVADWPYSSFHRFVREGSLPADWGAEGIADVRAGE